MTPLTYGLILVVCVIALCASKWTTFKTQYLQRTADNAKARKRFSGRAEDVPQSSPSGQKQRRAGFGQRGVMNG